jgi:transposase
MTVAFYRAAHHGLLDQDAVARRPDVRFVASDSNATSAARTKNAPVQSTLGPIELRAVACHVDAASEGGPRLSRHALQLTLEADHAGRLATQTDTQAPETSGSRLGPDTTPARHGDGPPALRDASRATARLHPNARCQQSNAEPAAGTHNRAHQRASVLAMLLAGSLDRDAAAAQLDLSARQLRRLMRAFRTGGLDALRHGNAGRAARHSVPECVRATIVELARTRYAGLSQVQLTQRLAVEQGIALHRTTVRRILLAAGLSGEPTRTRRARVQRHAASSPVGHRCLGQGRVAGCRCEQGNGMSEVSL